MRNKKFILMAFPAIALLIAAAPKPADPQPVPATCSVNGGAATRCIMVGTIEDDMAGLGVVLPSRDTITLVGKIGANASFSVDAVQLNDETFPSYGQCVLRAPVVRCRFGPTAESQNFTLTIVADTI